MRYHFAGFHLDADRFELARDGEPVAVQPKALRLLLVLLEERHRTLAKGELLDVLWEGTAVTEGSLTRAVALARAALGESGEDAQIVRTVHGVGYGIGVDVTVEGPAGDEAARAQPPTAEEALLVRPAVAVLPFSDESGDPDQEYLGDALAEGTLSALADWRWFPVIARKASFRYRGAGDDPKRIGRELGARYIVDGQLRRMGNRIRLAVQLVDAASAEQLVSRRFEGELADVFDLEDRIALEVATEIEPRIRRAETRRALRQRPENLDAWDCSIRALWHVHRGSQQDFAEAHRLLDRAVELDPASSYAQSVRALCSFEETLLGWSEDPDQSFRSTLIAAQRAVELDADDWLAHALFGLAWMWTHRDHDRAIEEVRRALALNPSASIGYQFLGCVLEFAGEPHEAMRRLEACLRLDPRYQSTSLILSDLALCHLILREPEPAISLAERAISEQSNNVRARQRLASALAHQGRLEDARRTLAALRELQVDVSVEHVRRTYPFRRQADLDYFLEGLRAAGLE
jgi:TolB-like protein/Tfp pilus assembly protein PilF